MASSLRRRWIILAAGAAGAVFAAGVLWFATPPDVADVRRKRRRAEAILRETERKMSERAEEEEKFKVLMDAFDGRYEKKVARKEALKPTYQLALALREIEKMKRRLADEILDMQADMASLEAEWTRESKRLGRLEGEAASAPPARAQELEASIGESRRRLDTLRRTIEDAREDLQKSLEILNR